MGGSASTVRRSLGGSRFGHDPFPELFSIPRFVAQGVLSILLRGLQHGFEKIIGFMDRLILTITHLILPGFVANQHRTRVVSSGPTL